MDKEKISVIVPCYNEEEAIPFFYRKIAMVTEDMSDYDFEIIFVNDGSYDSTLDVIHKLADEDTRVKYLDFSRNFGKEAAIYAGLSHATGDYGVIMDADLQDPPELLPEMMNYIKNEGYDSVATRRVTRKGEPAVRSFFARRFYHLINKLSKTEIVDGARDYRLMNRKFIDAILELSEYNRFSKGLFGWVGFKTKWIEFENVNRIAGETKWSFWKLFLYSIEGIIGFSTLPLAVSAFLGILFCIVAFIFIIVIIVRTLVFGDPTSGWPSLACIILLVSGVQLFCMGILGAYLSKTYLEVKKRPIYICKDKNI